MAMPASSKPTGLRLSGGVNILSQNSVVIFQKASQMLAEADTIQKARELKNLALTAADWARRKGMGEEAINYAKSYALEAERKMGEMLRETKRATGGQPYQGKSTGNTGEPVETTIHSLGLSKRESAEAQRLASLPEEKFQAIKTGKKTRTEVKRELRRETIEKFIPAKPTGKYRIIYADPPWKYGDQLTEDYGATRFHYPSMSIADLCSLPIRELAEDNAVLFLWVTSPILPECFDVIAAWGFRYKASFVWDKVKHNMGHYNSVGHEFLLICTKGSCLPDASQLFDSVQTIERTDHSRKPDEFRKIIETLYIRGEKIELFAREEHDGWTAWGNEVN
jgi:N6-adenosine-specific RNA methylase IME4